MNEQKICRRCGETIESGSNFCPKCGARADGQDMNPQSQVPQWNGGFDAKMQNGNGKKRNSTLSTLAAVAAVFTCTAPIGIILAVVDLAISSVKPKTEKHTGSYFALVFGILACIVVYANFSGKDGDTKVVDASKNPAEVSTESSQAVAENEISKGQSFEKDRLKVTVGDIDRNFKDYDNDFQKPDKGKKYIKVSFFYENNSDSDKYVSIYDFNCYADGELCEQIFDFTGDFINANISKGRKVSFDVYFAVPKKSESIELEYTSDLWSDEKVIIKVK